MTSVWAITKREVRTYFNSPVAYIVATVFVLLGAIMFFPNFFATRQAEMRAFFGFTPLLLTFIVPAITMRLLAEERSTGTLELLVTMPIRESEIVVGKFLAAMVLFATMIALTFAFLITVSTYGSVDKGPVVGAYLGLLLLGGAYAGIGVMVTAFTRNQIVAYIVSFAICFSLFIVGFFANMLPPGTLQTVAAFISSGEHFENISRGVVDTRDVLYYLSLIGASLLVATTALQSRKWS